MRFVSAHQARTCEDVIHAKKEYLRSTGWECSSDHPYGLWLWSKDYDGKTYRCDLDTALHVQDGIEGDESVEAADEEWEA